MQDYIHIDMPVERAGTAVSLGPVRVFTHGQQTRHEHGQPPMGFRWTNLSRKGRKYTYTDWARQPIGFQKYTASREGHGVRVKLLGTERALGSLRTIVHGHYTLPVEGCGLCTRVRDERINPHRRVGFEIS